MNRSDKQSGQNSPRQTAAEKREAALKAALRANLQRRKSQTRARATEKTESGNKT